MSSFNRLNDLTMCLFNRLELQKRMPWFCIHEPVPDNTGSQKSVETATTGSTN